MKPSGARPPVAENENWIRDNLRFADPRPPPALLQLEQETVPERLTADERRPGNVCSIHCKVVFMQQTQPSRTTRAEPNVWDPRLRPHGVDNSICPRPWLWLTA